MSQRRTRYTAYFANRDPQVILAYSLNGALNFYEKRGYQVTKVVKGDQLTAARNAAIKAKGGFKIDYMALRAAIKELGLKLPVDIRYHARVGDTRGNYAFDGKRHNIMLKSYHTPEQASATLWHELTHAMQAERCGATAASWNTLRHAQKHHSYERRPIEVEARAMSAKMVDRKLTKPL